MSKKTIFIVSTPIGNLSDISKRQINTLKEVDIILCENELHSKKLLRFFDIQTKTLKYEKFTEEKVTKKILDSNYQNIALISDAGTPTISDPGATIVDSFLNLGHSVVPIPGITAFSVAASVSGFDLRNGFVFLGFLPKKKTQIIDLLSSANIYIFYESPNRIIKTLQLIIDNFSDSEILVARELTKANEQLLKSKVKDINLNDIFCKGEFTIVLKVENSLKVIDDSIIFSFLETQGHIRTEVLIARLYDEFELSRNRAYKYIMEFKKRNK